MRLLRRNTTEFEYRAYQGETETIENGMHTGNYTPTYAAAVKYRGNISAPSGFVTDNLFGINTRYTHVLLMDKPDADISEDGLIDWNGSTYEIRAVRPSINVLAVALRKRTENHQTVAETPTQSEEGTGETPVQDESAGG